MSTSSATEQRQGQQVPLSVYPGSGVGKMVFPDPDRNPGLINGIVGHSPIKVKTLNLPALNKQRVQQVASEQTTTAGFESKSPSKGTKYYSELARQTQLKKVAIKNQLKLANVDQNGTTNMQVVGLTHGQLNPKGNADLMLNNDSSHNVTGHSPDLHHLEMPKNFGSQGSQEQELAISAMSHLIRSSFVAESQSNLEKGSEIRIQDEDSTLYGKTPRQHAEDLRNSQINFTQQQKHYVKNKGSNIMTIHHSQMRDPLIETHEKDSNGTLIASNNTSKHQYAEDNLGQSEKYSTHSKFVQHARDMGYQSQHDVNGKANTSLPPVKEAKISYGKNTLSPERITSHRMPHLSPVGSLTNLLTDLSSTGFRKKNGGQSITNSHRDSSLARSSKMKKVSRNPAKDLHHSLTQYQANKFRREITGEATLSFLLEQQDDGEHFYSPKVAANIDRNFSVGRVRADMPKRQLDALARHYQASAIQYLNSDQRTARMQMLETVKQGGKLSVIRAPITGVSDNYLIHRQTVTGRINPQINKPSPKKQTHQTLSPKRVQANFSMQPQSNAALNINSHKLALINSGSGSIRNDNSTLEVQIREQLSSFQALPGREYEGSNPSSKRLKQKVMLNQQSNSVLSQQQSMGQFDSSVADLIANTEKKVKKIKSKRAHAINLEQATAKNKKDPTMFTITPGETFHDVLMTSGYAALKEDNKEAMIARQQMQASHLSQHHLQHNVDRPNIYKDRNPYQKAESPLPALHEMTSQVQMRSLPGLISPGGSTDQLQEQQREAEKQENRLEYPLKEKVLNSRGQSIVYLDYKDRFRTEIDSVSKRKIKDRQGLGDLLMAAGQASTANLDDKLADAADPVMEKTLELEADRITYNKYNEMKLVNPVQCFQKNPDKRSTKEKEYLVLYLRENFDIFRDVDKKDVKVIARRLNIKEYQKGELIIRKGKDSETLYMLLQGSIDAYVQWENFAPQPGEVYNAPTNDPDYDGGWVPVKTFHPIMSIGDEAFFQDNYKTPHTLIAHERTFVCTLTKKDFSEVLYYRRNEQKTMWLRFLTSLPFMKAVPFHISQDMSENVLEQVYMAGETIYEVGDKDCDCLYFIMQGKVKVEAKFQVSQDIKYPVSKNQWEIKTKTCDIQYFIKQLERGGFFGLEELVAKGYALIRNNTEEFNSVKRKLAVTAIEDTKVLFLPAEIFHKEFNADFMLAKLNEFCETTEITDLEERVRLNWLNRTKHGKKVLSHAAAIQNQTQSSRIAPWVDQAKKNDTKSIDITVENSRVKIMNTVVTKQVIGESEQRFLNTLQGGKMNLHGGITLRDHNQFMNQTMNNADLNQTANDGGLPSISPRGSALEMISEKSMAQRRRSSIDPMMRSGTMSRISGQPGNKKLKNQQYEIDFDPDRSGSVFGNIPEAGRTNKSKGAFGAKKSINAKSSQGSMRVTDESQPNESKKKK